MTNFETASFYDKQNKLTSAKVYYQELVTLYPETPAAAMAQKRLQDLTQDHEQAAKPKKFLLW